MAKILVLGAGMVGSAMARDLAPRHQVVATDRYSAALARLSDIGGIDTKQLDASDDAALRAAAAEIDLVICALPGFLGFRTLKTLIEAGSNVADISFMPEDALKLDDLARDRGVVVVTDVGVAPGLDHLILGHHDAHMQVRRFECLVGGLPKERTFPWQYKAPFSPMDVIEEYVRPARKVEAGRVVVMPALSEPELVDFDGVGRLEAFNTDGLRSLIRTMGHVPDMREKTLRYPGHRDLVLALRESGFLSGEPVTVDGSDRHSPDDIQIRGNRTTGPPPRERHLLLQPSDGLILVSGLRLEGHSVIFLAIQTHLSCRFLLTVDFLGPTPERVLAADHRSAVGFSETGRGSPPPPPIGT